MRTAAIVRLSTLDQSDLEEMVSDSRGKRRNTLRAQVIQLASERKSNKAIAGILGTTEKTAARWRRRFLMSGTAGIEERPRSGRPSSISDHQVKKILAKFGDKRLTTRAVARIAGVSASSVRRIWKSHGMA
jgi:transposase